MLVLEPDEVSVTDTADHAIDALAAANVTEVVMLGRRGPAQAAFTNPELRELGELTRADVIVDPADLEVDAGEPQTTTQERNVGILREFAAREPQGKSHRVVLKFFSSPVEILGDDHVTGVRVVHNEIVDGRAVPTGEEEVIECDLVLRSIGYRGEALCTVPFDTGRGLVRNDGGRVLDDDGNHHRGEYVAGWIKRGPSGVIGTNKKDAADTVARVVEDLEAGRLNEPISDDILGWLDERVPDAVTWSGWQAIDAHETSAGEPHGRPRIKLVRVHEMLEAAKASAGSA
jgi:ferredoxin--NADP+ reductase